MPLTGGVPPKHRRIISRGGDHGQKTGQGDSWMRDRRQPCYSPLDNLPAQFLAGRRNLLFARLRSNVD